MGSPAAIRTATHVPFFVPMFNPLAHFLMRRGVPMGPNALLDVLGRKSGQMRTTGVAIINRGGRQWIIGTFGEVNWVRNLRAAGEGTIGVGRRRKHVRAVELSSDEAVRFFSEVLKPYVESMKIGRLLLSALGGKDIIENPTAAARPVFELLPADGQGESGAPTRR